MLTMAWRRDKLTGFELETTGMARREARIAAAAAVVVVCDAKRSGTLR
jgi:hypothetical protein